MSLNSSHLMDQIHNLISTLFKNTAEKNRMNLGDQANYLEDLFGNIFNELYSYQAINFNQGKANQPAVDLIDKKNKVMIQVTSRQSGFSTKKKETVDGFLKQKDYDKFKKLYLLFLTDNTVGANELNEQTIRTGCVYEGVDKNKLLNKIKSAKVPLKEKVLQLLLEEMAKRDPVQLRCTLDLDKLKSALNADLEKFLSMKYFANTNKSEMPQLLGRQVRRYNQEIKVNVKDLQESAEDQIAKQDVIVGQLSSLMLSEKPTFLFGEMGSGKSTMAAEFLWRENQTTDGIHMLIPANLIKGNISEQTSSLLQLLASFLTDQLLIRCDQEQIYALLKQRVVTISFDGLDELALSEARNLVVHLTKLSESFSNLTIIATGRPIELTSVVNRRDWNCLCTIDLSLQEMTQLLINESIAEGQNLDLAKKDAEHRIAYIKTRTDLLNLAVTPLVLTMIRDHLTEQSDTLSLGDILYKVIKAKLSWDGKDPKKHTSSFFDAYPSVYQREKFAAALSESIYTAEDKSISEEALYLMCSKLVDEKFIVGSKLSSHVAEYLKSTFLQKTNDKYSFISQPLLDTAYGIYLSEHLFISVPTFEFSSLNWRAISIAAAVIRARGESASYRDHFGTLLETFLVEENKSTQAAVIVQEFRDSQLAERYIELLKPLQFRPLRTWKDEDTNMQEANSYAPIALANAIYLAGQSGFDWFFTEYLDLRSPLSTHETGLSANLLLYYLIRKNYSMNQAETVKIRELARYVSYYRNFATTDILPVISLLIPEEFQPVLRGRLLLMMLKKDAAAERAGILIKELVRDHGEKPLLEAIEVYAQETERNHKPELIKLWYQHYQGEGMNDAIFKATISAIIHGDTDLMGLLISKTGKEQLFQYLKLLCLTDSTRSDESAILLYEYFGLSDFYMVARPIMQLSKWSDGKDLRRKHILNSILFEGPEPAAKLVRTTNFTSKDYTGKEEIPLLGFEYLVKSFLFLKEEYPGYFNYAIKLLPQFALTRNPELRDAVSKLLSQKTNYFDILRNSALSLDINMRRNSQQLMISCMPSHCGPELVAMVRGSMARVPTGDEWLAFVNKLDFSREVLEQLYQAVPMMNPWAKTHALIILYRNQYLLSEQEISNFARLLMGKGRFYDSVWRSESQNRILEDPVFLPMLLEALHSDEINENDNVASLICHHHQDRVLEEDALYALVLEVQHSFYIFHFLDKYANRFSDSEFLEKLQAATDKARVVLAKDQITISTLLKAYQGSHEHWVNLLELLFFQRGHFEEQMYHGLYAWLTHVRKHKREISQAAGKAALQLATARIEPPGLGGRSIKGVFLLLAHEFYQADTRDIAAVLSVGRMDDELYPALAIRAGEPAPGHDAIPFHNFMYSCFKENKTSYIWPLSKEEINTYLGTGVGLPIGFGAFIRSIVYYGSISEAELSQSDQKAPGKVIQVILRFVSSSEVDFKPLLEMMGQAEERALFTDFKGIFRLLKEVRLQQPGGREIFIQELKNRIMINRKQFLGELEIYYVELFQMKVKLEFEFFEILIEEIISRQYVLQMDLLYLISEHIAEGTSASEHDKIAELCYVYISSTLASSDVSHEKDYYQIQWLYALIYLYVKKITDPQVTFCFLMGMQSLFIQDSKITHLKKDGYLSNFKGRDLINHTASLFERIPESLVGEILEEGLKIEIPEIRVVCRLLRNFHLIKERSL